MASVDTEKAMEEVSPGDHQCFFGGGWTRASSWRLPIDGLSIRSSDNVMGFRTEEEKPVIEVEAEKSRENGQGLGRFKWHIQTVENAKNGKIDYCSRDQGNDEGSGLRYFRSQHLVDSQAHSIKKREWESPVDFTWIHRMIMDVIR